MVRSWSLSRHNTSAQAVQGYCLPSRNQALPSPFPPASETPRAPRSFQAGEGRWGCLTSTYVSSATTVARTRSLLAARECGRFICSVPNSLSEKGKGKGAGRELPHLPQLNWNILLCLSSTWWAPWKHWFNNLQTNKQHQRPGICYYWPNIDICWINVSLKKMMGNRALKARADSREESCSTGNVPKSHWERL